MMIYFSRIPRARGVLCAYFTPKHAGVRLPFPRPDPAHWYASGNLVASGGCGGLGRWIGHGQDHLHPGNGDGLGFFGCRDQSYFCLGQCLSTQRWCPVLPPGRVPAPQSSRTHGMGPGGY